MRLATPSRPFALPDKLALIVGVFAAIVVSLLALGAVELDVMSGVRAYVAGEGSWSKGQKDAVVQLRRYAVSRATADWTRFNDAIAVPLGDHQARLELEKPRPDGTRVTAGFVAGRNHPDDVPLMAMLFRRLGRMPYMADAIATWTAADAGVLRLLRLGDLLHAELTSPAPRARRIEAILQKVGTINDQLTPLEDRFSRVLGEGARWVKRMLLVAIGGVAALLVSGGAFLSFLLMRRVRETEERYRALFENANDLVYSHDLAGNITEVNAACEQVTGYPRAVVCRMNIAELVAPEHLERARAMMHRKIAPGGATGYELDVVARDGRRVPLEISARMVRVRGQPVGVQGIARDITDRRRAEHANARLVAELQQTSRLKTEFLSTMSHELRTPLNVIMGYAEMVRDQDAPLEVRRFVERIDANARDLLALIEGTLEIGRIEAQRDELRLEAVDFAAYWEALSDGCERLPRRDGVILQWAADLPAVSFVTDPRKLTVVVRNLVGNALKFTERGWVRVTATLAADALVIRVADSGIGIRPEDHEVVFEMFRQADGSDARRFGGSGLGLYIVRRFVDQLRGTVDLESVPGRGSIFTVTLPSQVVATPNAA